MGPLLVVTVWMRFRGITTRWWPRTPCLASIQRSVICQPQLRNLTPAHQKPTTAPTRAGATESAYIQPGCSRAAMAPAAKEERNSPSRPPMSTPPTLQSLCTLFGSRCIVAILSTLASWPRSGAENHL